MGVADGSLNLFLVNDLGIGFGLKPNGVSRSQLVLKVIQKKNRMYKLS